MACTDPPKCFGAFLESLKCDSVGIPSLLRSDVRLESENIQKANILNEQFKKIVTLENYSLPLISTDNILLMLDIETSFLECVVINC